MDMPSSNVLAPVYFAYVTIIFVCRYFKPFVSNHPFEQQNISIVNTITECQVNTQQLVRSVQETRAVGFDCEWVGNNKVALLQLASVDGFCVLIRLCKLNHVPAELKAFLEDVTVLKVGVAPLDDAKYLRRDYGVDVRSCLDLRHLVINPTEASGLGLASLTASILRVELDKRRRVRCSNWEADELDAAQLEYAARDALSAVKIFVKLAHSQVVDSLGLIDRIKYSLIKLRPTWDVIASLCQKYLDRTFKQKSGGGSSGSRPPGTSNKMQNEMSAPRYQTMKNPHYDNCWILAPDGVQISTCCQRKVEWYVKKGLGEIVSNDPVSVQLFFEPSGRITDDKGVYNLQLKVNQCVVCGLTESLIRKKVIPQEYKKYFPLSLVEHITHDVLLLCITCHQLSNFKDTHFKRTLEEMSFNGTVTAPVVANERTCQRDIKRLQYAARALLSYKDKMPATRCSELETLILNYYGNELELTESMLADILSMEAFVINEGYQPHAHRIVEKFKAGPGLVCLQEMWREHFIATMQPRFLPPLWSVTHNHIPDDIELTNESAIGQEPVARQKYRPTSNLMGNMES